MNTSQVARFGPLQIGIILLTLVTASVHLVALNILMGGFDVVFTLNGLGYLALLAAMFLPLPFFKENHSLVRWAMIGFAILTILAWIVIGDKSWPAGALGYFTKLDEIVLVILLWSEGRQ